MMLLVTWTASIDMVEGTERGRVKSKKWSRRERERGRGKGKEEQNESKKDQKEGKEWRRGR